jgi:3',5'-cyclic AMP phosphodiesterase CpdA
MKENSRLLYCMVAILAFFPGLSQPADQGFTFVFMTDIHVQPEKNAVEGFRSAIRKVNELKPEFVVTGGDLIMDALGQTFGRADSLYDLYTSLSKEFDMPVYNTLGNHEIWGWYDTTGALLDHPEYGEKMYEQRIGPRYHSWEHKGWLFFSLDSVEEDGEGEYQGEVDSAQMDWIRDVLSETSKLTPIVISLHIPLRTLEAQILYGATVANERYEVVINSKEVLDLFSGYNLRLVLQGHLHYYETMYAFGTHFVTGGAVSSAWWEGRYMGTEEGFLLVRVEGGNISWNYVDYGWEAVQDHSTD